jgi:hypothetical protein
MCWDILNNLNNDYRLLFKYRFGLPTVAYFVSRRAGFLNPNQYSMRNIHAFHRLVALGYILAATLLESK